MLWALVPAVLVLGVAAVAVLAHRLDTSVRALGAHTRGLRDARLATVVVEDDLEALRAALAQMPRR